ncbi:MFS transporter [Sphingorhabdus contaminans]|uniref:POT-type proton-dependent oligopeptide transporter n=1 Tax=Sphingorhabdus contaminans TaxID=1343899 RepID=UPI001477397D|nr:MFS transporter [Sphingorhabdus contaminans]
MTTAIPLRRIRSLRTGQPDGFATICFTKFWERVAYYGLQAILILYLTEYLLVTRAPGEIWLVASISTLFNVQGQALASSITGGFLTLISIIPIVGGIITDRFLGPARAILLGGSIMVIGHLAMAYEPALILALACIALGIGLFRGAIASQLGSLYDSESRRVEGFQLYFLVVNIAGLTGPFLVGTIGEEAGWHWGFAASASAMAMALAIYAFGYLDHARIPHAQVRANAPSASALPTRKWPSNILLIAGVGLLAIPNFQLFNAYLLWVKKDFALMAFGQPIPVSWLVGMDAALSLCVLVASVPAWRALERHIGPVSSLTRASFGALFVCAGTCMLLAAALMSGGGKLTLLWCVAFQFLNAAGLAQILPAALAELGSKDNVKGSATSISGYFLGLFFAGLVSTVLAARFEVLPITTFWSLHLGCAVAGAAMLLLAKKTADHFVRAQGQMG